MHYDSTDLTLAFAAGMVLTLVAQFIASGWIDLLAGF